MREATKNRAVTTKFCDNYKNPIVLAMLMTDPAPITKNTLLAVELFRELNESDRTEIAGLCVGTRFCNGEVIVSQHDNHRDIFFIVSGSVLVKFHSKPGKDVQFRELGAGESFGELSAIDGEARSAEVVAHGDVFVGVLTAADFLKIATHHPDVGRKLLEQLTAIVRSLSSRVIELSTLGVANRIHAEILRLARQQGVVNNQAEIKPAPTHADLAGRVSTQREAVTKELGALVRNGVLTRSRGALLVADVAKLESMVVNVAEA